MRNGAAAFDEHAARKLADRLFIYFPKRFSKKMIRGFPFFANRRLMR